MANGAQAVQQLEETLSPSTEGFTLVRTIFDVYLAGEGIVGAVGRQVVSYGIGLVSEEAFTAGVVPDPNTNTERPTGDWVVKGRCMVTIGPAGDQQAPMHCMYDLRSSRKLAGGRLTLVMNNDTVNGTAFTIRVVGQVRSLLLRP